MERLISVSIRDQRLTDRLNSFLHFWKADIRQLTAQIDINYNSTRRKLEGKTPIHNPVTLASIVGFYGWEPDDFLRASDDVANVWATETTNDTVYAPINQGFLRRAMTDRVVALLRGEILTEPVTPTDRKTSAIRLLNGQQIFRRSA